MNRIPIFQVDAFTSELFGGNPAAICPLQSWLDNAVLQSIAAENNLAETAFIVAGGENGEDYALRWFTPTVEARLCGHATLATAHVIFEKLNPLLESVSFSYMGGRLDLTRSEDGMLVLAFSVLPPAVVSMLAGVGAAIGLDALSSTGHRKTLEIIWLWWLVKPMFEILIRIWILSRIWLGMV